MNMPVDRSFLICSFLCFFLFLFLFYFIFCLLLLLFSFLSFLFVASPRFIARCAFCGEEVGRSLPHELATLLLVIHSFFHLPPPLFHFLVFFFFFFPFFFLQCPRSYCFSFLFFFFFFFFFVFFFFVFRFHHRRHSHLRRQEARVLDAPSSPATPAAAARTPDAAPASPSVRTRNCQLGRIPFLSHPLFAPVWCPSSPYFAIPLFFSLLLLRLLLRFSFILLFINWLTGGQAAEPQHTGWAHAKLDSMRSLKWFCRMAIYKQGVHFDPAELPRALADYMAELRVTQCPVCHG